LESEEMERLRRRFQSISRSQRSIVDKEDKSNRTRLQLWAVFLIVVGGVAAYILPEHSVALFFDFVKTIITSLLL